jgi:flagellar export protein FliJ
MTRGFQLDQVLEHARRREEQQQLHLKTLADEERRLRGQLEALRDKAATQARLLSERARVGAINPAELSAALGYLDALSASIAGQQGLVASCAARVLETREQLVAILQEKQSLETLKRKHDEAERRDASRLEAKALDDLTSTRFVRGQKES